MRKLSNEDDYFKNIFSVKTVSQKYCMHRETHQFERINLQDSLELMVMLRYKMKTNTGEYQGKFREFLQEKTRKIEVMRYKELNEREFHFPKSTKREQISTGGNSLKRLLDVHFGAELTNSVDHKSYKCMKCRGENPTGEKRYLASNIWLYSPPESICINFKRFKGRQLMEKNDDYVKFDRKLDISSYVISKD